MENRKLCISIEFVKTNENKYDAAAMLFPQPNSYLAYSFFKTSCNFLSNGCNGGNA